MKTTLLLMVPAVQAFPSLLGCPRLIDVGETIMGAAAVADTSRMLVIERGADVVPCDGEYVPGETLNARIDDASGLRYIMELSGAAVFDQTDGNCDGELCSGSRCAKGTASNNPTAAAGQAFVAPTDGSDVVLRGAWASGFGAVSIVEECVLTAGAAAANPTAQPTTAIVQPTTAPVAQPTTAPVAQPTAAPVPQALPVTNETVPPYAIVKNGTCASHGMIDILKEDECRLVMNDGWYSSRDENGNGVLDAYEDYPIPVVSGLPPGCWPVLPGTPGFESQQFPFACITPIEDAVGDCSDAFPCFCRLPDYEIITEGTCVSAGMTDVLDVDLCRALMDDGYYSTRDQDNNGILDSEQDYPIPVVSGLPPGCWPVEVGTPGFETQELPFACITPLEDAVGDCSDSFPCFCLTDSVDPEPPVAVPEIPEPDFAYHVVTDGTCVSHGMTDILDVDECRTAMNHGYYATRDQDDDGIIDAFQDYPIPVVTGLPPGCWPVEVGTPGFDTYPFACVTPLEDAVGDCSENFPCFCKLPEYEIVTTGTCVSAGYTDILDVESCRGVLNDGWYSSRDEDGNGVIDAEQDYPIPVVSGLPPGCWPVLPGTPGFETQQFPFACITELEEAVGDCSDSFPCFCNTEPQPTSSPTAAPTTTPAPVPAGGGSSSKKNKSNSLKTGALIAIIVVAAIVGIALFSAVAYVVSKRKSNDDSTVEMPEKAKPVSDDPEQKSEQV